ncbi:MAG: efflux RND transporter permease subunit, partial [Phycisphaeraceae bacterium]
MDLIRFAINRPVTITVSVILIVLFGLISLGMIPIQMTPNIEQTVISVDTRWEGASPDEIEKDIIIEQEKFLRSVTGLRKMLSTARLGQGEITLEFDQGVPKELALREVSDKLREVPSYPQNVDEPVVRATNPSDRDYITWIIIRVDDPNFDVRFLQDFFDDRVKPELDRVTGVAEVNVLGGFEREVHVSIDPNRMAQHSISPSQFAAALQTQNRDASAGELVEGKLDIRVRSVGRYDTMEQIESTLISSPGESIVRVKDVADVSIGFKKPLRTVRNKGQVVLAMNAQREVGSNVIAVMEQFRERLAWVEDTLLPAEAERLGIEGGIQLDQVYDQTVYINDSVELVQQNILFGGSIAVIVLMTFLRSARATAIIALAIPTSVIGTFVVMAAMGRTLNVISLAGLAFAVGLVVDNAIVVLENIDRHIGLGEKPAVAAYKATQEVWGAILASTLTTISVFIPILLIEEEAGQLFRDIALAICAAVSLSLLVAITVIPSAASRWLKPMKQKPKASNAQQTQAAEPGRMGRVLRTIVRLPAMLVWGFGSFIDKVAQTWVLRLAIIVAMTGVAIVGAVVLVPASDYLPQGNRNLVFGMINTPPAYNLEQKVQIGRNIEESVRPYWELHEQEGPGATLPLQTQRGEVNVPGMNNFFFVATPQMMFMGGTSNDDANVPPVQAMLNHTLMQQAAIAGFATQMPLFQTSGRGAGNAMELEITGADLEEVSAVALHLRDQLRGEFGFGAVQANPTNFDLPG